MSGFPEKKLGPPCCYRYSEPDLSIGPVCGHYAGPQSMWLESAARIPIKCCCGQRIFGVTKGVTLVVTFQYYT